MDNEVTQAARVRARRNALLAWTDWSQLPDIPGEKRAEYAAYRQALRDLPARAGFPYVKFPTAPSS